MKNIKTSTYQAHQPDHRGIVHYPDEDHHVWHDLIIRQKNVVLNRACPEYIHGLSILDLPESHIPQCEYVSAALMKATGWQVRPVAALIPFKTFFTLLANKEFPAATFIRRREELDYLQEPDIFHEFFGHCPLLTHPAYADFTQHYGQLALKAPPEQLEMLARLFWFTIEFGLIQSGNKPLIYGGGILSSFEETQYAVDSPIPVKKTLDILEVFRTPYRIDIKQPIYFIIENFDTLYHLIDCDLADYIKRAQSLGMLPALFTEPQIVSGVLDDRTPC